MSPAASNAIPVQASKVFRGDDDSLVDQLIAASQEHKFSTSSLPGFGRELKPYFDDNFIPPLSAVKKHSQVSRPTYVVETDPPQRADALSRASSPNNPTIADAKNSNNVVIMKTRRKGKFPRAAPSTVLATAPACPGIFSSPNPQLLPRPSLTLFNRATSPLSQLPGPVMALVSAA